MFFKDVSEAPADPIFGLNQKFSQDSRKEKVYLSVGIYMDENANAPMLHSVKKAQRTAVENDQRSCYLPIDGDPVYVQEMGKLVFGERLWNEKKQLIYGAQTVGGTSALRISGDFLERFVGKNISVPNPTWANHIPIFEQAGLNVSKYPYYSKEKRDLDFDALLDDFSKLKEQSIILLHASCHNPTGADLNQNQWKEILKVVKKNKLLPLFDMAYQGLGEGTDKDAYSIRLFAEEELEMIVTTTASKNFGLYQHRVGSIFVITTDVTSRKRVQSQIKKIIRSNYSNPPAHGDQAVVMILQNPDLRREWEGELKKMRDRLEKMRKRLIEGLKGRIKDDWSYLSKRNGLFVFCDFTKEQVHRLIDEFAIYLTENGRINLAGLNESNIDYVIDGITRVLS